MKRAVSVFITICVLALGFCGCSDGNVPATGSAPGSSGGSAIVGNIANGSKISAEKAKEMMDSASSFILLDVRTESEYQANHIESALLIPNDEIGTRAATELPDKNQLIIVYCSSGTRSANATATLVGMGYTNVYDMGRIGDWPYGTISSTGSPSNLPPDQGSGSGVGGSSTAGEASTAGGSSIGESGSTATVILNDGTTVEAVYDKTTGFYKTDDDRYFVKDSEFSSTGWIELWPYPISEDKKVYQDISDDYGLVMHVWLSPIDQTYHTSDGTGYAIVNGHWVTSGP